MSNSPGLPVVALAGNPNCGKTALFNALTGNRQKVANYPGVTVEKKEGRVETPRGRRIRVVDLPGAYSLTPQSPDEKITHDILNGDREGLSKPDAAILVADATNLERSLGLLLEIRPTGIPVILSLNMYDLAETRGLKLDLKKLSEELGVPVVPTVAVRHKGLKDLLGKVDGLLFEKKPVEYPEFKDVGARFAEVDRILKLAVREEIVPSTWTARIDRVVLHPVVGPVLLAAIMALMFQAVFTWAGPLQDGVTWAIAAFGSFVASLMPAGPLKGLLVDGIIEGVGAVLVFIPQILLLFLFILLLEASGYMARAAFLMDRIMRSVGLHGRAFIPLLSSFACSIPGIMATRTIEQPRDRLATILISPLMTCAARLPVYTLLIAAFIPNTTVWGPFKLQGAVMFGLYIAGIFSALGVAFVIKKIFSRGSEPALLLELPTYKMPALKDIAIGLWERAKIFIRRAGTIILSLTVLLWFLASYPKTPNQPEVGIADSYAGQLGKAIEPVLKPLGFDWRISIAMIPGFAAREVMVGALATVYAIEDGEEEVVQAELGKRLVGTWSLATALSLLIWYVFAPQCLSTIAVTRRETNSWKWPGIMLVYLLALAYVASFITYQLCVSLGLG